MDKDTGRAKGYGFVMFKTRKGARKALRNPEKRMFNRNVSCNLAAAKPSGAGKPREPVESVKIELTQPANQIEMALPGLDLAHGHGLDKGMQQQNMPMYGGPNMPFYGHSQPPLGYNPMYGAFMGNQMVPGLPNYRMFGPGMMNQGPPNHMGMAGQFVGEGNVVGPGFDAGFDGERAWYLR
uniref:UBP1-associated proteins 1B n=2 Tax=Noccaea caerulescens TaxID=107243 RepID=A0A1J3FEQ0_NOCCA